MREGSPPPTCHITCVACHVSCVRREMSYVMCHTSHVTCNGSFFFLFFGLSSEASRWRVCYQRGLPCLVFYTGRSNDKERTVKETYLSKSSKYLEYHLMSQGSKFETYLGWKLLLKMNLLWTSWSWPWSVYPTVKSQTLTCSGSPNTWLVAKCPCKVKKTSNIHLFPVLGFPSPPPPIPPSFACDFSLLKN